MHSKLSIGIAGGTGSGKTTLSKFLASGLSNYKVTVIYMDKYYKKERPVAAAPFSGKLYEDFNHPTAIDIDRVVQEFNQEINNEEQDIVIIEGFLLFHFPEIRDRLDYKIFVDCPSDERLIRRTKKFSEGRYSHEEVIAEYLDLVRHRHNEYVEPTRWYADVIINGSSRTEKGTEMLRQWIIQTLEVRRQKKAYESRQTPN